MLKFFNFIIVIVIALIVTQCANSITAPVGGPKDLTPPKVLESSPKNGSANFSGDRFIIQFNEFITLKDIQQSALISPPMKEMPDFKIKNKTLQVKFNEELKPNTTYSVYFGDAITDITENNPLSNYTYIFSTGKYVDSLSLYGNVINAFDLLPVENAFVMLYKDNNDTIIFDSLPYFVVPYYLSKTDVDGKFQFSGLSDDNFMLFSLLDQNSNFIFDQPGEQIGFIDSLIHPTYFEKPLKDTLYSDSIAEEILMETDTIIVKDTVVVDSAFLKQVNLHSVDLYMFLSPDTIQRLLKSEILSKNILQFSFSQPAQDVNFEFQKYKLEDSLYIKVFSDDYDTITWYLNNPPIDSLELLISQNNDTLGNVYLKLDPTKQSTRVKRKDKIVKEYLTWKSNTESEILALNKKLEIQFLQPMVIYNNLDSAFLITGEDTIPNPVFNFTDTLNMTIRFPFDIEEETNYRIFFPDSAFSNWNNLNTEPIDLNFRTLALSEYGILTLQIFPEIKQSYILQMLDDKENVLEERRFYNDKSINFEYLKPAIYRFKIIYDNNDNGSWDPGDFGLRLQPEEVIYFEKEVKVRANWEIEEEWKF